MRTHTTLTLRNLIKNDMDASKQEMTDQQIDTWLKVMPDIYQELIGTIRFFTHSIFQKGLVRRQVAQMQKEVISLLDALEKMGTVDQRLSPLKAAVLKCLEQLMDYLMENCGKYLDLELHMPQKQLRIEKLDMESRVQSLEAQMKQLSISSKLQQAILEAFQLFLKHSRCSYAKLNYLKGLATSIRTCCEGNTKGSILKSLSQQLMKLNFNSQAFIAWYEAHILEGLGEIYDPEEQAKYLYCYEMDFQRPPFRNYAGYYDKTRRKSHELMYAFICKEKSKLPPRRAPESPTPGTDSTAGASEPSVGNYRIRTVFSVDALAYFIRLLVQAKVIEPGVRTELLSFIAKIFSTPGTGSNGISATSLGSRYKQVVQTTALQVRAALMRMVGIIDAEFG